MTNKIKLKEYQYHSDNLRNLTPDEMWRLQDVIDRYMPLDFKTALITKHEKKSYDTQGIHRRRGLAKIVTLKRLKQETGNEDK